MKCADKIQLTTGNTIILVQKKSFTTEQSGRSWSLRRPSASGLYLPSSLSVCSDFFLSWPATPAPTLPFFRRMLRLEKIMKSHRRRKNISRCITSDEMKTLKFYNFYTTLRGCCYFGAKPLDKFYLKEFPLGFRLRRLDFP